MFKYISGGGTLFLFSFFLHIYGLTAPPVLKLLISQEGKNARGFLDFLVLLLMQFCLSEKH